MPLEMNPEIRARWIAALRSGDYLQTRGLLHDSDGYCCLGVLCDLAASERIVNTELLVDEYSYDGENADLPAAVISWAAIPAKPCVSVLDKTGRADVPLAVLNDEYGWDFGRIADAIEGTP